MKAALYRRHGGPEVLEIAEVPDPRPGPADVLLAVHATGLNYLDVLQRQGPPLIPRFELPHTPGMDISGVVVEVGDAVRDVAVGDRVLVKPGIPCGSCASCRSGEDHRCTNSRLMGGNAPGGYSDYCVAPATHVYPVPDGIDLAEAATISTAGSTAWRAIVGTGHVRIGETVVIHAAGSGVSVFAIQIAKRAGATVIVTSRSDDKLIRARGLGADVCINSSSDDVVAAVREATNGQGADMVFDHVGPALFNQSIRSLRAGGRLVFCGTTTGVTVSFDLPYVYHNGLSLLGVSSQRNTEYKEMLSFFWTAGLRSVIDSEMPLSAAGEAHARLERGDVFGKIVLRP